MADVTVLEIDSDLFAQRLAGLLVVKRRGGGYSRSAMARQSSGRFTTAQLRRIEAARTPLSHEIVTELTGLYEVDLAAILPQRAPMAIAPGALSVGGASMSFVGNEPTSLLRAYLRLVRALRNEKQAPIIAVRRDDIDTLAAYLGERGEDVLDRLAALMGTTRSQRASMTALFSVGAAVLGIVGVAAIAHHPADHGPAGVSASAAVPTVDQPPPAVAEPVVSSTPTAADDAVDPIAVDAGAPLVPASAVQIDAGDDRGR